MAFMQGQYKQTFIFKPGRYAAIDIGTVTCRMLVADVDSSGGLCELDREYAIVNLGEGVDRTHRLKPEAIERAAGAVERYLQVLRELGDGQTGPARVMAVATSASRDADNADDFRARLARLGVTPQVIPGEREAALSVAGAACGFEGTPVVVVDVGGGSTEIVAGMAGSDHQVVAHSFDIGCRRVTERVLLSDPPTTEELDAARAWMRGQFEPYFQNLRELGALQGARMIAVAGTATSIVSMRENMVEYDTQRVHHAEVSLRDVDDALARLSAMTVSQREHVVGLDPGRAPVIVAGAAILSEVMRAGGFDSFTASESDILQGIILDMARTDPEQSKSNGAAGALNV